MVVKFGSRNPYDIADIVDTKGNYLRITRREYMRRKMEGDKTLRGCRPSFQPEDFRSELLRKYGKEIGEKKFRSSIGVMEFLLRV